MTAESSLSSPPRQSGEKVIEKYEHTNEPLEFREMHVMGTETAPGEKFSSKARAEAGRGRDEDWLEGLGFTLKNRSDKEITHILFQLQFPETQGDRAKMVYTLHIGIPPYASARALSLHDYQPLALSPGESVGFSLPSQDLKFIKDFLALDKFRLADLSKAVIKIVSVNFLDGTKWEYGYFYKPNPSAPLGWERID